MTPDPDDLSPEQRDLRDRLCAQAGFAGWADLLAQIEAAQAAGMNELTERLQRLKGFVEIDLRRMADRPERWSAVPGRQQDEREASGPPQRPGAIEEGVRLDALIAGLSPRLRDRIDQERRALGDLSAVERQAFWKQIDEEAQAAQAAERVANRRRRYVESRPPDYAEACYERLLPQQNPAAKGSLWLRSAHTMALIMGPSGHGKSYLAYAISNHAAEEGMWVEAWYVPELMQVLASPDGHERNDEVRAQRRTRVFSAVRECELLILDELGAETASGYRADEWTRHLMTILKHRCDDSRLRTVVVAESTNRRQATDPLKQYGARIITRLHQDCVGIWIEGECLRTGARWAPF
ncbi:hypothetical protein GCM10029978_066370 [Actinoallomurus acanthiterrae]